MNWDNFDPNPKIDTEKAPRNLSSHKRLTWVLYRHGFYLNEEGRGVCQCNGWSVLGGTGTWEEHVADLIEEVLTLGVKA